MNRFFYPLLFLLAFTASLIAEPAQLESLKVGKIDIIVDHLPKGITFNPQTVRSKLQTKVGNLFSQTEFDADLKLLAKEYAEVNPKLEPLGNELNITIRLQLKPIIHQITFSGNQKIKSKKLLSELDIDPGSPFDRDQFITALNKAKLLYVKKGYFEADMQFNTTSNPEKNEVDIHVTVNEGRAGRIKSFEFKGFSRREEKDLLEMMVTKKYNFLLSWYTGRGTYHPEMMDHDKTQIINYLQDRGYADAIVDITIQDCPDDGKIILIISTTKGPIYHFGNVTLTGNQLFSNDIIFKHFKFGPGSLYSPQSIRDTTTAIQDLYGASGYIDARVDIQLRMHEKEPLYDVAVVIDEGKQYNVGMVRVFGNQCTHTPIILHECLLTPGEVFDLRKIKGTEERLSNTGYFSSANVYAVRSNDCPDINYRDVFIEVEETDTGNLGIFFGFSSLENVFGGVDITEQNFNIAGLARVFGCGPRALRGAGEFLHFKANLGSRETAYLLQWTKPYFLNTPWIVGFDLEKTNNRLLSKGYEVVTYGGNVHGTYILNDFMKWGLVYRALHTRIKVKDNSNPFLVEEGNVKGLISAVGASFIYDSTDHPRRPTQGFRSKLSYEIAGLGGDFQFMKYSYLNTYYFPLIKNGILKFRGDIQFIQTYGRTTPEKVPLSERLFLGGETTVRGYRNFIIGPLFGNNEPRGGLSSYLISEEYQHTLLDLPRIDAFAFCDAGYVSFKEFTLGKHVASVGFGLRMEVLKNMPMTFGLGFPIHPYRKENGQKVDTTQRFFFAMGGSF